MHGVADRLFAAHTITEQLVIAIGGHIRTWAKTLSTNVQPQTILESRFSPASEAYARGMVSCGTISNISAEMLRHLQFRVKLIDGRIPQSPDHAWISVYDSGTEQWQQYDLAQKDGKVTSKHIVEFECDNWTDIREHLEARHQYYQQPEF